MRDYEPIWALDGGEDGLRFYKGIIKYWKSLLRPGGCLMFEVGEGQASAVCEMLMAAGFASRADEEGHPDDRPRRHRENVNQVYKIILIIREENKWPRRKKQLQ